MIDRRRRSLWIGDVSKRAARTVERHVEELARAKTLNVKPDVVTEAWLGGVEPRIRKTLTKWELADPLDTKLTSDAGRFLDAHLVAYISGRTDLSAATISKYERTRCLLVEYFGADRLLAKITEADADRFDRWLRQHEKQYASSTIAKHLKRAKTMFNELVLDCVLPASPFCRVKVTNVVDRSRDFFVTTAIAEKVFQACPDNDWRVIFALARVGGLRRCEILALTWGDVLWDVGRLRIDSPKTGVRFCPLWPELRQVLGDAFAAAPDESTFCVQRYRRSANLGTQMNRIIALAGIEPWPKTFHNCRATRRTELQGEFKTHVVNAWIGHGSAVAEKHYLQVTDDDFDFAANSDVGLSGGALGGALSANLGKSAEIKTQKNPEKTRVPRGLEDNLAPPGGLEPPTRRLTAACSTN